MDEQLVSISDVAERTGLKSSALRYYERSGLFRPRTRVGGRRHYDSSVLQTLAVIALLQEVGFTISEIKTVLTNKRGRDRWRVLAQEKTTGDRPPHRESSHNKGASSRLPSPASVQPCTRATSSANGADDIARPWSD